MLILLKKIFFSLGIDKAIFYTSLARVIQAGGGVISILFVAKYLSSVEQGFYYTFGSIVAIQVFFELGLNGIITQYVAHEVSHLKCENGIDYIGEQKYLSRLSSLLHFSIRWYSFFSFLLLLVLTIVGFVFFTKYHTVSESVTWRYPWILLAVGTSLNLLFCPIWAFIEGLGKIKEIAKIRLLQQSIGLLVVWGSLLMDAKLYTPGINWLAGIVLACFILFFSDFKIILINLWKVNITERVNYKREIFPYQWKIALSWISGYFIFQLFNPVLFATEGAIVAGQMGMTLAALNGIQALGLSWITTKIPVFSGLIAQQKYLQLDNLFQRTLKQAMIINGFALLIFYLVIVFIRKFNIEIGGFYLGNRFLAYLPLLFMIIPVFINQMIIAWATYLRCHKKEPFLWNSISVGILCCLSTIILGKYWGVLGITSGYCLITFFSSFWGYWIFKTKKNEWHGS